MQELTGRRGKASEAGRWPSWRGAVGAWVWLEPGGAGALRKWAPQSLLPVGVLDHPSSPPCWKQAGVVPG